MLAPFIPVALVLARRGEPAAAAGCGAFGCFALIMGAGLILFLVLRGRNRQRRIEGASARPMGSGPIQPHTFACPFSKCPNCGASADRQRQQWDGLRAVTWSCGYCGHQQVQQLRDEELPPSARQRLGLDRPAGQDLGAYPPGYQGGGMGGTLGGIATGMMLGHMLGGNHANPSGGGDWTGGGGSSSDNWDSGSSDWGSGDSGGDSGGWDSGGSDWGGDSGGDSGGDW